MKITFVLADADLAGGVRVVAIHARGLAERGHNVTVLSTPPRPVPLRGKIRSLVHGSGWPRSRRSSQQPSHLDSLPRNLNIDHRRLRRRHVTDDDVPDGDVVIATWWETAEWVWNLSPSKGAKAYFLQGYEAHQPRDRDRVDATWLLPMHKIVVAEWLADRARRLGDERVSLIPNAVDPGQFHAPLRGKQPRPTVGLMYSTVPFKGCDIALQAIERASTRLPSLRVIAFGEQPPARGLPLPRCASYSLRPAQDSLRDLYASCDAWLFASRVEGFGLPILEAMACRTPVIGTPAGAAPELLPEGGGLLVAPESPAAMADAILRMAGMDDQEWRRRSDAAHNRAAGWRWAQATDAFEQALQVALERAGRGEVAGGLPHSRQGGSRRAGMTVR